MSEKYTSVVTVDPKWGIAEPIFNISGNLTGGKLKYLHKLQGKKVKITLEVIE